MPEHLAKRPCQQQSQLRNSATMQTRQHQMQHMQQIKLLSSISALREELNLKIQLAKQRLNAVSKPSSDQQPISSTAAADPPELQTEQSPAEVPHKSAPPSGLPLSSSRSRQELKNKLAKVRLDFDLLLAKQHCLLEKRKLQKMRQEKQQQQQKLRSRRSGLISKYSIRAQRSPQHLGQRKFNSPATARQRHRLSSSSSTFRWRRHVETATGPGLSPSGGLSKLSPSSFTTFLPVEPKVKRSRSLVERAKLRLRKRSELCVFYCRFGHCRLASSCQYLHDPKKVAICRRFLRNNGACCDPACRLSHCLEPTKLPQCEFQPACDRGSACPYAHANLAPDAPLCRQFSRMGHCLRGVACPQRHAWPAAKRRSSRSCSTDQAAAVPSAVPATVEDSRCVATHRRQLPDYIPVPRAEANSTIDEDDFGFD